MSQLNKINISLELLLLSILYAQSVYALGGILSSPDTKAKDQYGLFAVISNENRNKIGTFGGITSAYDFEGNLRSVTLTVLDSGYIAPILDEGQLAGFGAIYFGKEDCAAQEFLPISQTTAGLIPKTGFIYKSLSSGEIRYLPKDANPVSLAAKSVFTKNASEKFECINTRSTVRVIESKASQQDTTGFSDELLDGNVIIEEIIQDKVGTYKRVVESVGSLTIVPDDSGMTDSLETESFCVPGCPLDAVGNGYCDIQCFTESCTFDGGDCAALSPEDIAKEQAAFCSTDCLTSEIGDGFCDVNCNNFECELDGGDCK